MQSFMALAIDTPAGMRAAADQELRRDATMSYCDVFKNVSWQLLCSRHAAAAPARSGGLPLV